MCLCVIIERILRFYLQFASETSNSNLSDRQPRRHRYHVRLGGEVDSYLIDDDDDGCGNFPLQKANENLSLQGEKQRKKRQFINANEMQIGK